MEQKEEPSMLRYMRKIWREEYWASDDIEYINRCGKMVRAVDFRSKIMR